MDLSQKSKDLNRSDSQTLSVNLTGLNLNSIIGESMNDSHSLGSLQRKERENMKIKVSQSEYTDSLWRIENTIRESAEAFNVTDEEAISEQVTKAVKEYEENHEVKGGTHQDCIKGEARVHLKEILLPALTVMKQFTKEQGLVGKGNCNIDCGLNWKILKDETTTETTTEPVEITEPVETEESEKTK